MMSPNGISDSGAVISVADAIYQLHLDADQRPSGHRQRRLRRIGRRSLPAFKFLNAETDEERANYDWMGYIGNFVAIISFLPLPFAGYWLAKEIYAYSQTLGLTMMGGAFSWLFIIQAVLIGNLFLGANYYLWLGMGRSRGRSRSRGSSSPCSLRWSLFHDLGDAAVDHRNGLRDQGDEKGDTPILGFLGVMSAKNTAVNILILTTFMSFLLYRRTGKVATVSWAKTGQAAQLLIFAAAAIFVFPRHLWVFRRGERQNRPLGTPGQLRPVRDGVDYRDRRLPLPPAEEHGRGALGKDACDLPVHADLHRGDVHLAHGAHGLRAVRAPPALACLRCHPGHFARRLYTYPRLRDAGRLGDRAGVLPPDWIRVLAREPARPAGFRRGGGQKNLKKKKKIFFFFF